MQTPNLIQRKSTQYQYLKAPGDTTEYSVRKTIDYSRFEFLTGNRNTSINHLRRLKESFSTQYLISPIIVNEKLQIIDGQHRFKAAQELGLPIYYIIVNGYGLSEVQTLNTNSQNWKKIDFLNGYCDMGIEDYLKFRQFMKDFPDFGFAVCEVILTNKPSGNKNQKSFGKGLSILAKTFENGEFKIDNLSKSYKTAKMVLDFKPFYSGYSRYVFVSTLITIFNNENYNHNEMIHKLRLNPTSLVDCTNVSQYRTLIEDIYNYKRREKVNLKY